MQTTIELRIIIKYIEDENDTISGEEIATKVRFELLNAGLTYEVIVTNEYSE